MAEQVIKWRRVDDALVVVTGTGSIPDDKWVDFANALETEPITKYLGISIGSVGMTSVQRKQGAEIVKRRNIASIVVTDDRLVRGVVTAVGWLGANVKAYAIKDLEHALRDIDLKGDSLVQALSVIEELRVGMS